MKSKIDLKRDHHIVTINSWEVYITKAQDHHYLKQGTRIVFLLGAAHNEIFGHALSTGILLKIRYDEIDGIESFGFTTTESETVIMTNSATDVFLTKALQKHTGGLTIMTPSQVHMSGEAPFAIDAHPSGKAFDIIEHK